MKRTGTLFAVLSLLASSAMVATAGPAVAASSDSAVAAVESGLLAVADWYDDLEDLGELGLPLPLLDLAPGGAEGLDLGGYFGSGGDFPAAVAGAAAALSDSDGIAAFATELDAHPDLAVAPFSQGGVAGLDVAVTRTVSVEAPLLVEAAGIDLRSVAPDGSVLGPGVTVDLTFTTAFELRADVDTGETWIVHRPAGDADPTPAIAVSAAADFDFSTLSPPLTSAFGIARVDITTGTFQLDAAFDLAVDDTDGDGMLAFMELSEDGTTLVPGELTLPRDQNVTIGVTGDLAADFGLATDLLSVPGAPDPRLTASLDDLSAGAPTVTPNADLEALAGLTRVGPTELLGGLGQLSLLLVGSSRQDAVDVALPFLDISLADAAPIAEDIAQFVLDHSASDDPATLQNEYGQADFATFDDMVEDMLAELPGVSALAPVYDTTTERLSMAVSISESVGGAEAITVDDVQGDPVEVGRVEFSGALPDELDWLSGLSSTAPGPTATARFGYALDFVWGVDLREAADCQPCDDPFTEQFVEVEEPSIYERFLIGEGSGDEISITALVEADASALAGSVGFLGVEARGGTQLRLGSATDPIATVDLTLSGPGGDDLVPIAHALRNLTVSDPANRVADVTATLAADLTIPAELDLTLAVPTGSGDADLGGVSSLSATLTWTDVTDSLVPAISPSGAFDLLAGFDIGDDPNALLGVILDHVGALAGSLAGFADGVPVLGEEIPFTSVRPGELFTHFEDLAAAVDDIRGGVEPESLQELVALLDSHLAVDGLTFSIEDRGGDGTPDLVISLQRSGSIAAAVPLTLELGTGDLVGVGSDGRMDVSGAAALDLRFPIPVSLAGLPASPSDLPIDEASSLDLSIDGSLDGSASLTLAGIGVTLGPGEARLGFSAAADASGAGTVGALLTKLADASGSGVTLTATNASDCTVEGVVVSGALLCAAFPMSVAGETIDVDGEGDVDAEDLLRVSVDDFSIEPSEVQAPDLTSLLESLALDLDSLPELVDRIGTLLAAAMRLGGNLPLVGEDLDAAAGAVEKIRSELTAAVTAATEITGTVGDVRTMLRDEVADTLAGSGLLVDADYDGAPGTVDAHDVLITLRQSDGSVITDDTLDATTIADVTLEFGLGEGDPDPSAFTACGSCSVSLPLDFGLPALQVATTGDPMSAGYAWQVHLGIGISRTDGPYLMENPRPPAGGDDTDDTEAELALETRATFPGSIDATLGVFEVSLTDEHATDSNVRLGLSANLNDPNDADTVHDARITIAELPGLASRGQETFAPSMDVVADFELGIVAGAGTGLPRIKAVLDLDWTPFGADPAPRVAFDGFQVHLGDLFDETFGPILGEVRRLSQPVDPIREFLFSPLPVLSDLSQLFGGDDVTFVDLAELFGEADLALLQDINDVMELSDAISSASGGWVDVGEGFFLDADRATDPLPTAAQAASLVSYTHPSGGSKAAAGSLAGDVTAAGGSGLEKLVQPADGDFSLPVVDEPSCLFGMLLGGDCTILEWTPDPLALDFEYDQAFGPFFGVLYVTVGGFAGAGARAGIGFDTHGARRLIEGGEQLSAANLGSAVLDGVFLLDLDGPELFVQAGIVAGAKLSVLIAEAGARGGVAAALGFDLNDGPNVDGKLRIEEIVDKIHNPLCLFDVVGALEAFLEVYVEIGACPFCVEESFELARVVLLDFSAALAECDQDPLLARVLVGEHPVTGETGLPYVRLVVGPDADPHRRIMKTVSAENFTVREMRAPTFAADGSADTPGLYSVSAFGHSQTHDPTDASQRYEGYWVDFDAGGDNDSLLFQGSKAGGDYDQQEASTGEVPVFTAPVTGDLGPGDDVITTGDGDDHILGGPGKDQITLLGGNDTADGGGESDTILGGLGTDTLSGGDGGDRMDGGPGGDDLDGGPGEDRIDGGRTVTLNDGTIVAADLGDTIQGGTGDDLVFAGDGDDTIYGGTTADAGDLDNGVVTDEVSPDPTPDDGGVNDEIHGEGGNDTIYAGQGSDLVFGDLEDEDTAGDPTAALCAAAAGADAADDTIYGQGGNDAIDGSRGCDELHGGDDADDLTGGPGDDRLFGDGGADVARGGTGDDDIEGGTGNDELHGEEGDDDIVGNLGEDHAYGGPGDDHLAGDDATILTGGGFSPIAPDDDAGDPDHLFGEDGTDVLHGQGDGDELRGGRGPDLLFGNDGADHLYGDRDDDVLYGNAGTDTLEGGPEDDLLFGNSDADHLYGQTGDDRMIGGSDESDPASGSLDDGGDFLAGGAGFDVLLGDNGAIGDVTDESTIVALHDQDPARYGDDDLDGGADDDVLHGQDGDDDLWGAGGDDQLFGELGADSLFGQSGHDVMLGDRGTVTPAPADPAQPDDLPGGAPDWTVALVAPTTGGEDDLHGGLGDDRGYGGAAADLLEGGVGDDHLEGNGGPDDIYGLSETFDDGVSQPSDTTEALLLGSDQDDLIGGSSTVNPDVGTDAGAADSRDVMFGNADDDVMAGDNADIDRVLAEGGTTYAVDDVTGGHARTVVLHDRDRSDADLAAVSGGDRMLGNGANDRMYGQGGRDVVKGNADDDFLQGNQDDDLLEGNDGEDDLIGGSEFTTGPGVGDPDGADALHGGAGADVLLGDNGIITRRPQPGVTYTYVTTQLGIDEQRAITLLDLDDPPAATNFGDDLLSGGAGVDVAFGQDGEDVLSGGPDDDYQEGNGGSDGIFGDRLPTDASLVSDVAHAGLTVPALDAGVGDCAPPVVDPTGSCLSPDDQLHGPAGDDGQDDQIGGSSRHDADGTDGPGVEHRDGDDVLYGDGEADFQLGDNGQLLRTITGGAYTTYHDYDPTIIVRQPNRFDVEGPPTSHGDDLMHGGDGADRQWGQDGDDTMHGDAGNDDMYGELGDDTMFGGTGEDAMVGDRGLIVNRLVGPGQQITADTQGPEFLSYVGLREGTLDRRVDLLDDGDGDMDGDGDDVEAPGLHVGGGDRMRGGPDHDVMHGAFGDDLMNGDSGGDWMFGADGADVMWGGRGCVVGTDAGCATGNEPGDDDEYIDILFGGHGATSGDEVRDADVLDWRPVSGDPEAWFEMTGTGDGDVSDNQHHHGIDWIYGGFDRDVLQGDVGRNGPEEFGDRLIDWTGAYNLFTRCNASYGDDGDIRKRSPSMESFLETVGFGTGVGASADDVRDPSSSAYRELGIVYKQDTKANSGAQFPDTPGNFFDPSCEP